MTTAQPNRGESRRKGAAHDGIRVTDVWETREQFERFAEEQIGPSREQAGISGPTEITFHDVHGYLTAG